jgi:DNA repair exonuclease SbcCD ATPase subunit
MRLVRISLQNFLSYGPRQDILLDARGLVAVLGLNKDSAGSDSNGSGKSGLLEGVVWVLFGETMRGYRGDEVINRVVGKNCFGEIEVEDNGDTYVVNRTRKAPAKKPNNLVLEVNGKDISQGVMADTQALINTIVGMDFKTFSQSVMLSHGHVPFSQLTDKAQKEVLEDILQIGELAKAQDAVRRRVSARSQDLATARAKLDAAEEQRRQTQVTLNKLTEQRRQHAQVIAKRKRELQTSKAATEARIAEIYLSTGLAELIAKQEKLQKAATKLQEKRQKHQQQRLSVTQVAAQARGVIEGEERALLQRQQVLKRDMNAVDALVGKECPTCHQVLTPDAAESCMDAWAREEGKIRGPSLRDVAKKKQRVTNKEQLALDKITADEKKLSTKLQDAEGKLQLATAQVHKRQATLQLICELEQQAWNYQQEIDSLDASAKPYDSIIEDTEAEITNLEGVARRHDYRIRAYVIELSHLQYWNHGFGNQGLKSYLLDSVVPYLTTRAQHYADILSGGDLRIEFSTQTTLKNGSVKDQFQVKVTNQRGADVYQGNSDGEKQRIDLAVGWALGDLAATRAKKPIRFKALDEPFTNLDETGEDGVVRLLHAVLADYETILCITHSTHLRNQFPQEIVVTRENDISTIS